MKRIIVGITGASGTLMAEALLTELKGIDGVETHLIISDAAKQSFMDENHRDASDLEKLADVIYDNRNIGAAVASGSFETEGMIVIPCSMKSLSGIANGYSDSLLLRAADVCIKEGRKTVLVPREMPLSKIHLRNLSYAADAGCIIIPPMLSFYENRATLSEQIDAVIGKVLSQFGFTSSNALHWTGNNK